jgi:hypothetical protein
MDKKSINEGVDEMDEVALGYEDDRTINDHEVIKRGTTW